MPDRTNMDAFSTLMQHFNLEASVYNNSRLSGDWNVHKLGNGRCGFHMITHGCCHLSVGDEINTTLEYGDLVIFTAEVEHQLYACPQVPASDTGLLCANVNFSHVGSKMILNALPKVFVVRSESNHQWVEAIQSMLLSENTQTSFGTDVILNRLSELVFIYALRQELEAKSEQIGLLALYKHQGINQVLTEVHNTPEASWTVESMASFAAMSRTRFANLFKQLSGWTPMEYLTWWRMQLAWSKLQAGHKVYQVAQSSGYRSEAAFSRAFSRHFKVSAQDVKRQIKSELA
ncbi:AraC family transcriptional regulator [Vibrio sonorensis]|uniref:AraC family transcriptional regulator n=1 Tax=Vibrio sonorensis TaxID=1004316 RepID=UPI0008DA0357|nr:AraC family transcriptional regulator [Vibrio sonorensis]